MLHKIDFEEEHVAGFRWEGKFDEKAFKQSLVQFLPELERRSKLNIYAEVVDLTEVEAKALWEGIKFDIKNFNRILKKIDKVAYVTDIGWMRTMAEGIYSIIPGVKFKAFEFKEAEAAKTWIK